MEHFICPVCGQTLFLNQNTYSCKDNHCFDKAKSGYVNLLRSQSSSAKRHGDDKLMIRARTAFLEKGYYRPLLEALCKECDSLSEKKVDILDVGCGEGWYTDALFSYLREKGKIVQMAGIDISKDALATAARRNPKIGFAVASISALPIKSESVDILFNLFAPAEPAEFSRVLKKKGRFIKVIPLERHLWQLKEAIYDTPYENVVATEPPTGFVLKDIKKVEYRKTLTCNEDIEAVFKMTPYYYKTSVADQAKVKALCSLETELAFGILTYEREGQ